MKKTVITAITVVSVLFAVTMTVPVEFAQTADATKASGVKNSQYGHATKNKVCGDRLCSEIPYEERHGLKQETTTKIDDLHSQIDLNDIMDEMDKIHESHQSQMIQMWQAMTPARAISNASKNAKHDRKNEINGYESTHENDDR